MSNQTVLKMLVELEIASAVLIELEIASAVLESKLYINRGKFSIDRWSAFGLFYAPKLTNDPTWLRNYLTNKTCLPLILKRRAHFVSAIASV